MIELILHLTLWDFETQRTVDLEPLRYSETFMSYEECYEAAAEAFTISDNSDEPIVRVMVQCRYTEAPVQTKG